MGRVQKILGLIKKPFGYSSRQTKSKALTQFIPPDHKGGVLYVDDVYYDIQKLDQELIGSHAFAASINQNELEKICTNLKVNCLEFKGLTAKDWSPLQSISGLTDLRITWALKVEDISPLTKIPLISLYISDTKRLTNLEPLSDMKTLEVFEFSGGMWSKNTAESLAPLERLPNLKELTLTNLKVIEGGLKSLANCNQLHRLRISNQFPTEEYAYLMAKLPNVKCNKFVAYEKIPALGPKQNDVMITGSRKPWLNSTNDSARIQKYENAFKALVESYSSNS
jgi:hypothetical protein